MAIECTANSKVPRLRVVALSEILDSAPRESGRRAAPADGNAKGKGDQAAPRDNVIFEAGFFVRSKGHERVLVVREKGAKMPADLGGVVYEALNDRADVQDLEERLRLFLETSTWSSRPESSAAADAPQAQRS